MNTHHFYPLTNIVRSVTLIVMVVALSACVELKQAGRTVGHTSKDVAKDIGHASREVARDVSRGTKRVVNEITADEDSEK